MLFEKYVGFGWVRFYPDLIILKREIDCTEFLPFFSCFDSFESNQSLLYASDSELENSFLT